MKTLVITTNPNGHTVSKFDGNLSPYQVVDRYMEFYDDIDVWHDETCTPHTWYIRCHKSDRSDLYRIRWNNL